MSPSLEHSMFTRSANLSARRPLIAEPQKPVVVPPRAPPRTFHRPTPQPPVAPRNVTNYNYEYQAPNYWKPCNVELERRLQEARAREKVGYFQEKVTPDLSLDRREAELVFRFDPQASAEYLTQYRSPVVQYTRPATPAHGCQTERDGPFVFGVHSPSQFPLRRDHLDYDYSEVPDDAATLNGGTHLKDDVSDTNCCDKVNEWTTRDKKARRTLNRMFQVRDRRKVKGGNKEKIKCVLVGDGAVGKSSLIAAYAQDTFREEYTPTAYDTFNATKRGTLQVVSDTGIQGTLEGVLFCPEVPYNLLSVSRMQRAGLTITFDEHGTYISKDGTVLMRGEQIADALTKPLPAVTFMKFRNDMGLL